MSTDMMKIIAAMKSQIATLESMVALSSAVITAATKKRTTENKVKKPLPAGIKLWQDFNRRLRDVLKANDSSFNLESELKQFAKKLKDQKNYAEWTDEEILQQRQAWVDEHTSTCPVCDTAVEEAIAHRDCARTYATEFVTLQKGTEDEGLQEWMKLSGLTPLAPPLEPVEKKKAGRPKMTEEQKAAAKAARDALTPEQKAAAKAAKAAKKVVSDAPKVAWGSTEITPETFDDLESVESVNP
jgi:hypothetical protein